MNNPSSVTEVLSKISRDTQVPFAGKKAMEIDSVLELISSFLSMTDLKNFRLVNKQWNRTSLETLRQKVAPLNFLENAVFSAMVKEYLHKHENMRKSKVVKLVKNFYTSDWRRVGVDILKYIDCLIGDSQGGFPCLRFVMDTGFLFREPSFPNHNVCDVATHLGWQFHDEDYLMDFESTKFPSLKFLKVDYIDCVFDEVKNNLTRFRHILTTAPNLEGLHLSFGFSEVVLNPFIQIIIETGRNKQLKTLHLQAPCERRRKKRTWLCLKSLECRLKTFSFQSNCGFGSDNVRAFLDRQADSLEAFTFSIADTALNCDLPKMKKLKFLELQLKATYIPGFCLASLYPTLKVFRVGMPKNKYEKIFNELMPSLPSLEVLAIPVTMDDSIILEHVPRMFPNLRRLETLGPELAAPNLLVGMHHLKELSLDFECCTIDAFSQMVTGYTEPELEEIKLVWEVENIMEDLEGSTFTPHPIVQEIQVLEISNCNIDDVTAQMGLARMNSLKRLHLQATVKSAINMQSLTLLQQIMNVIVDKGVTVVTKEMAGHFSCSRT